MVLLDGLTVMTHAPERCCQPYASWKTVHLGELCQVRSRRKRHLFTTALDPTTLIMPNVPHLKLAALSTLTVTALASWHGTPVQAAQFAQQEVDPTKFAVIASPYAGGSAHQLLIVEQLNNTRSCWSEAQNGSMTVINPLLVEFDFTNICSRSIDSNGYSIRTAGEDMNWRYSLRVVRQDNDMLLLGTPTSDRSAPSLVIGRVRGVTNEFAKIQLEPGWRLTKRSFNGQAVGHVYLTNDQTIAQLSQVARLALGTPTPITRPSLPGVPTVTVKPQPNPPTVPTVTLKPQPSQPIGSVVTLQQPGVKPAQPQPTVTTPVKPAPWWQFWNWGRRSPATTQSPATTSNHAPTKQPPGNVVIPGI